MANVLLHPRTIHSGFSHIVPLDQITTSDIRKIEENLETHGNFTVLGNNISNNEMMDIKCKTNDGDGTIFVLKFAKIGMIRSGAPEPLYAIAVIIGEEGFHSSLGKIYNQSLLAIQETIELPKLVISKEATIKTLYGTIKDMPSFQFLWEKILNQPKEKLINFGLPIAGGGLRIVIAPRQIIEIDNEVVLSEFKIESFLQDARYIYTEAKYNWQIPKEYAEFDNLKLSVNKSCDYIEANTKKTIEEFLKGEKSNE
jgi:hypothetical protein